MARSRVSEDRFVVAYDGPALAEHQMDVSDLARSLLAFSAAFKDAQRAIDPGVPAPTLRATATSAGSFEVGLTLIQPGGVVDGILGALTGRHATAAVNAAGLAALVWEGVRAVRWLAGRAITKAKPSDDGTTITTPDGDSLTIDARVLAIIADLDFRQHLSDALAPLDQDGVDFIEVRETPHPVKVTRAERRYFDPPSLPDSEDLSTTWREAVLQVVGVEFDWRKWRFTEGAGTFHADVEDLSFRQRVEAQEISLGAADLLKVSLRTRQYRDRSGALKTSIAIERVIDHINGGRQLAFDYEWDDEKQEPGEASTD